MKLILAACFLFIFCHGPRHHVARPQTHVVPDNTVSAAGKSCDEITQGFNSWGEQDKFVSGFPVNQQRRVLQCLDKLKRGQ